MAFPTSFARDLLTGALATVAAAQAAKADCGARLDEPMRARWIADGGAAGPLGCPLDSAPSTVTSRSSAAASEARFANGAILRHISGGWSGRTFLVSGCAWRIYFQYGGPAGWLGLPIGESVNTPDGHRQDFEGGWIRADRNGACDAEPGRTIAVVRGPTSPIDLFHDPVSGDDAVAGTEAAAARLSAAGYRRVETLGFGPTDPGAGVSPLRAFVDPARGAHLAAATADGEADARSKGFAFEGAQGNVIDDPGPGRIALKSFWNASTRRGLLATSPADEADARSRGYAFVRIEGYLLATPLPAPPGR